MTSHPHGSHLRYFGGCRCDRCRAGNAAYKARLELRHARGQVWADPDPVAEHLRPLVDLGIGPSAIGAAAGVYYRVVSRVLDGHPIRPSSAEQLQTVTLDDIAPSARMDGRHLQQLVDELRDTGMSLQDIAAQAWGWTEWQPVPRQVLVGRYRDTVALHARVCRIGVACQDCGAEPMAAGRWCWPCYRAHAQPRPFRSTGCGTPAGYTAHRRAGTEPCQACRTAHSQAHQRAKDVA